MTHRRFSHDEMHRALISRRYPEGYESGAGERQALVCPFYVPLTGILKPDWGVIVSPVSPKFGQLVFEHDACGCPEGTHGQGGQRTNEWLKREKAGR